MRAACVSGAAKITQRIDSVGYSVKVLVDRLSATPLEQEFPVSRRWLAEIPGGGAASGEGLAEDARFVVRAQRLGAELYLEGELVGRARSRVQPMPHSLSCARSANGSDSCSSRRAIACRPIRKAPRRSPKTACIWPTSSSRAGSAAPRSSWIASSERCWPWPFPFSRCAARTASGSARAAVSTATSSAAAAPRRGRLTLRRAGRVARLESEVAAGPSAREESIDATVPKRRQSHARKNKRRAHDALALPARATCPQCDEPRQPHRVCGNCGTYRGRDRARDRRGVEPRARAALPRAGLAGGRHGPRRLRGVAGGARRLRCGGCACSAFRSREALLRGAGGRAAPHRDPAAGDARHQRRAAARARGARRRPRPPSCAGHSLGEYTALVAAARSRSRTRLALVHARGRFMQEAVPQGRGAMAAVLGIGAEPVAAACRDAAARDGRRGRRPRTGTRPHQTVIAGDAAAVERAGRARARPPARSAPSPWRSRRPSTAALMRAGRGEARRRAGRRALPDGPRAGDARTSRPSRTATPARVAGAARRQVTAPVRFMECVRQLVALGVDPRARDRAGRGAQRPRGAHRARPGARERRVNRRAGARGLAGQR